MSVAATSSSGTGPATTTTNPVTPTITLGASTVVLTQVTMDALTSDAAGTLVWGAPAPAQVMSLAAGDVMVGPSAAAAPNGLLAKVTAVTNAAGVYHVVTTTAALADAFTDLSFGYSGDPLSQPGSTFRAATAGVRTLAGPDVKASLGANLAVDVGTGALKVTGQVDLTAAVELSAEVDTTAGLPTGVSLTASASVSASASLKASVSADGSWQIGEIDSPDPITIVVGVVPILVEPKLPVFLTVSGDISVGIEASTTIGAAMSWSSENPGVLNTTNLTQGPHLAGSEPIRGVSATATGAVGLQLQPQFGIYDLAGPNVEADDDLEAEVDFLGSPWFTLTPSVSEKVGLDFDILDGRFHGSLEVTLAKIEFPAFEIERSPIPTLTVTPADPTVVIGTPTTFTATSSDGTSSPLTWSLPDGAKGDSISKHGVLTTVAPAGRSVTVVVASSAGAVGQTIATVAAPGDPQGFGPVAQSGRDPAPEHREWAGHVEPTGQHRRRSDRGLCRHDVRRDRHPDDDHHGGDRRRPAAGGDLRLHRVPGEHRGTGRPSDRHVPADPADVHRHVRRVREQRLGRPCQLVGRPRPRSRRLGLRGEGLRDPVGTGHRGRPRTPGQLFHGRRRGCRLRFEQVRRQQQHHLRSGHRDRRLRRHRQPRHPLQPAQVGGAPGQLRHDDGRARDRVRR